MRIISYNVNGIRAAIKKGFIDWLATNPADIICLQETKATDADIDVKQLENLGFHHHWFSAQKKGYSGVAVFSKIKPDKVTLGNGHSESDDEGRVIQLDIGKIRIINAYFPSGTSGEERQKVKYRFLDQVLPWAKDIIDKRKKVILVGDYNIAHTEKDIHNPKGNKNTSGFLLPEREWLTKWFESGFHDSFRHLYPDKIEYSWWSVRFNSRATNKGWRIDYQSVTDPLLPLIKEVKHLGDVVHSDHCPVQLDLK